MASNLVQLLNRLRSHWPIKLGLGVVLMVVFCLGYFAIEYHPLRSPQRLELTMIDRAVPFAPQWVWVYQSIYLLFPAGWLCETRAQLRRYALGWVIMMVAGFTCFLLWPVAGPRPPALSPEFLRNGLKISLPIPAINGRLALLCKMC